MEKDGRDQCKRLTLYVTEKQQGGQEQKMCASPKAAYPKLILGTGNFSVPEARGKRRTIRKSSLPLSQP